MALLGALIVGWAVVLLAWNLYLFWFPSVDYKVGTDDESIAMTGKRGETITLLLNPGESVAAKWATSGITLSLTSPTLDPIDVEVVPFREPDWEEEIRTFSILEHVGLEIKGEFTIPRKLGKLAATGESTGASDPAEPGTYLGSLAGMVLMPVAFGEGNFATSALPVSYDVKLTVVSGEVSAAPAWTFVKN